MNRNTSIMFNGNRIFLNAISGLHYEQYIFWNNSWLQIVIILIYSLFQLVYFVVLYHLYHIKYNYKDATMWIHFFCFFNGGVSSFFFLYSLTSDNTWHVPRWQIYMKITEQKKKNIAIGYIKGFEKILCRPVWFRPVILNSS